jgi:transposase
VAAAPEILTRPRRRTLTAQTKLRVLAETDGAVEIGGIGAIQRREVWRRQRDSGALGALTPTKRAPKLTAWSLLAAELAQSKREIARLGRNRRLAKDFGATIASARAFL